jgi:succinate dehydrogenase / fumarate reductase iron-sulfur subunit
MGQIMRLRRIATSDHHIVDANNGERHEAAFTTLVRDNGLNWEAELLSRSYGGNSWFGKFAPPAGKELLSTLPSLVKALARRKITLRGALQPHRIPKQDLRSVQAIYDKIENREQRYELNLYISGFDEQPPGAEVPVVAGVVVEAEASSSDAEPPSGPAVEQAPADPPASDPSTSQ